MTRHARLARWIALLLPAALLAGAWGSQLVGHLYPCEMCHWQRWPHYAALPFALLHVDTGHNFPEVLEYRDATVERLGVRLVVAHVQDYIDDGRLRERPDGTRNPLQTVPLLDAIEAGKFDAVFGGGRRDEASTSNHSSV